MRHFVIYTSNITYKESVLLYFTKINENNNQANRYINQCDPERHTANWNDDGFN